MHHLVHCVLHGRCFVTECSWQGLTDNRCMEHIRYYIVCEEGSKCLTLWSELLAFLHIQGSHTGEHLGKILFEIICEMEIMNRMSGAYLRLLSST